MKYDICSVAFMLTLQLKQNKQRIAYRILINDIIEENNYYHSVMHFIITFGFSIPIKFNANIKNDGSTTKIEKKKVHQRKEKKISKNTDDVTESPKNIIRIGQILAEIHVEYELFPNYNFKFDCRCWETAAKIYTENNDCCLRPIPCPIKENTCWVIFSIHHLVHLNEIQIKKYFNHVIVFRIFYGKQKFCDRAKKDKVKGFYIDDKSVNVERDDFLEIYPLDMYHSNSVAKPSLPQPTIIADEIYGDFSIATYLDVIPDCMHKYLFRKMTRKERFPPKFLNLELPTVAIENDERSSSKQTKKSTRKKQVKKTKQSKRKQRIETYEIHLPASGLFSDMDTITTYHPEPKLSNISSVLIYAQCQNILSDKQLRKNMNPISIKLEQLSNFPVDTVIGNGFKCIYAKIFFVDRTVITPYYVPNTIMYFQFVKCFLYEEFQLEELINFLMTKFLTVEIIGIRTVNINKLSTSASDQPNYNGSVPKLPQAFTKDEVLLGVAEFDLSDLLRGIWEVKLTNSLIHPRNINTPNIDYKRNNENLEISREDSPLTADILTSYGTSVGIKVRLAYDLRRLQRKILRHGNVLNRIFFNLHDTKLANNILKDVSSHNSSLLSTYQTLNEDNDLKGKAILKHVLTGFVIKDCGKFYIFLEGLSNGYLLKIWEKVAKLCFQQKCIYYNSNYIFVTRLYEDFVPLGGIVHIKLSKCLEMQLRKYSLYIGKTGATLRANMIRKLGLFNFTFTMKSLCQTRLFPEPKVVNAFINDIHKIQFENTL